MTDTYNTLPAETATLPSTGGTLTYENKVLEKIVGYALEPVDGLLAVDGGFLNNIKNKVVNTNNVRDGIHVEVGQKQVAVDLNVIVEYQKHVATIFENIKRVIIEEVAKMTDLEVVEVNVNVVDIKTRAQHEADSKTVQDQVVNAAQATGEFTSTQFNNAKNTLADTTESAEPRVI
ncbi:Asp23/Gls24 family envelope stress response protein [Streptococcus merionis]|uniref:Asp23/Gls24 family envelope stress response protein n=1 Tax=Streptococcus merionis TaxID=400065 RepID=UPI003512C3E2